MPITTTSTADGESRQRSSTDKEPRLGMSVRCYGPFMTSYLASMTGIVCSALAACSTESSDDGTYHLAITFNARDSSPFATLTSTVTWPSTADVTLHVKDARTAQVEFLGEQLETRPVWVMQDPDPTIPDGTLYIAFGSRFRATVDDTTACPQTNPTSLHGSTVLYFRDGHVHGATSDDEICSLPGDDRYARFFFDVTGDRVDE